MVVVVLVKLVVVLVMLVVVEVTDVVVEDTVVVVLVSVVVVVVALVVVVDTVVVVVVESVVVLEEVTRQYPKSRWLNGLAGTAAALHANSDAQAAWPGPKQASHWSLAPPASRHRWVPQGSWLTKLSSMSFTS